MKNILKKDWHVKIDEKKEPPEETEYEYGMVKHICPKTGEVLLVENPFKRDYHQLLKENRHF